MTTTTSEIGWLAKACAAPSSMRPQMESVMTVRWAEAPWSVATNGHILVALLGEHVIGAAAATLSIASLTQDALRETERADLPIVDPGALLRWADIQPLPEPTTCTDCNGTGEVECEECRGEGHVECSMDYEHDCEDCEGEGHIRCDHILKRPAYPAYRVGAIDGVPFNRDNFWPLAHVSGAARMRAGGAGSVPMLLRGDGWLFVVMPMAANVAGGPAFASPASHEPEVSAP